MERSRLTRSHFTYARIAMVGALVCAATFAACRDASAPASSNSVNAPPSQPVFTLGSGTSSTLLGRATFNDPSDPVLKVKRTSGDWEMELEAKPGFDLAIQTITFQPGGQSGWHSHPGPVFIQVVSGTMTFYDSNDPTCTGVVRTAGEFLDVGDHAHIARNESGSVAQNLVTYLVPPGAALRIDEPNPGNCSF